MAVDAHPVALRVVVPGGLVVLVTVADLSLGDQIVFGLLCAVPLLVATFDRPRSVLAWGGLCLALQAVLGVADQAYSTGEGQWAQAVRVSFTVVTTVLATWLAARRMQGEEHLRRLTEVARTAQATILRDLPARSDGWALAVDYTAAEQEARVGGDLYDVLPTQRGLLLLVGDVRGKGLPAVRLASLVLGTFRHPDNATADPRQVLDALDRTVTLHADDEDFVTAVLAEVSPDGTCRTWNAGHPPPLLLRNGEATLLEPDVASPPLGLGAAPAPSSAQLRPGDRLLLYTDGLVEARRPSDRAMFPLLELAPALLGRGSLARGVDALRDGLRDWTGGALSDDVALLAVSPDPVRHDDVAASDPKDPAGLSHVAI